MSDVLKISIDGLSILRDMTSHLLALPEGMDKATARAMNRALLAVRTGGVRIARQTYTAKAATILSSTKIHRVSAKHLVGMVDFIGRMGTPLAAFATDPASPPNYVGVNPRDRTPLAGIAAKIRRDGTFKVYGGPDGEKPFFATRNARPGLFYRPHGHVGQHDVRPLFGPSPIGALLNEETRAHLEARGAEVFASRLRHEVERLFAVGK